MRISTNITALNTYNNYSQNNNKISSSVAKLSSGYSINSAADNATGLAISEKMRAQIRGLDRASANSQDAISLVQTAEGALASSDEILQRMRELAVQSASDTNDDKIDREALQDEFTQLQEELNEVASTTKFNGKSLIDGTYAASKAKVATSALANNGMTLELGNAAAGTYTFNISTEFEAAAVDGKEPTSFDVVKGDSGSYFGASSASAGGEVAASDLLNGDYELSASYSTTNKNITVTAKGDNGQTFTATIDNTDLKALSSSTALEVTFNEGADDAFKLNLTLASTIAESDSSFTTLASNLSELAVSVSGGVTAQEAQYGVYANLTGAASQKLEAGMDSVTFGNGVKINFEKLTTSAVDTANKATLNAGAAVTATTLAAAAAVAGYTMSYSNFEATDTSSIVNGANFDIAADAAGKLTATITDSAGAVHTYTTETAAVDYDDISFTAADVDAATKSITGLSFKDADGNEAFTLDLTAVLDQAATPAALVATNTMIGIATPVAITNSGHEYAKTFSNSTVDLSASTTSTFGVEQSAGSGLTIQVGANEGDEMVINIDKMDANFLGVSSAGVGTQTMASAAINAVDAAINQVSSQRAYLGAVQNRLDYKIANLSTSSENLTSAESQIRDVDMAKEMTNFTNANILQQAATAMLAQANSLPQNVLSLIG